MDNLPYSHLARGTLLVASPDIDAGLFFRSVVLICEHGPSGSFGLIVNKPLEIEIPEEIAHLKEIANPHVRIHTGGPIQPHQMMLLHSSPDLPDQTLKVCPGIFLGGDVPFLQQTMGEPHGPSLFLCFGYSGWASGYLEREFLGGAWFLHPASASLVFESPPEKMWQTVLREMKGKYATLSMMPEDLSLN
jgi:putative transcriptional regulator